jgi:hypothetical protein
MLENNNHDLNQLLLSKNQNINDLEELSLLTKNQLNEFSAALALQLEEKQKIQQNCQMFRLRRIGNLGSLIVIPTLLIIRRDLQNNYIMELENYYSKIVLCAKDIMELSICKQNRNKFYLVYRIPVLLIFYYDSSFLKRGRKEPSQKRKSLNLRILQIQCAKQ